MRSLDHALAVVAALVFAAPSAIAAEQSLPTAAMFSFEALDGGSIHFAAFAGHPVLVVNTASRCGFVGQLADLSNLWARYRDRGLKIIAVPSNDFRQEPGDAAEIRTVSVRDNHVAFPIAAKQRVVGADAHPFYRWAAVARPGETPRWNFHKYLVGADGRLVASFPAQVRPTDLPIVTAIEGELLKSVRN